MPHPPAVPDLSTADYEVIESAVMETARGRWFLTEYARRNRHADTQVLLAAIARLEQQVSDQRASNGIDRFKTDMVEMSAAIARTRADIHALVTNAPGGIASSDLASLELDAVVTATETSTSDILAATEAIQDAAWSLREMNVDVTICDALDEQATNIYAACSFHDLSAQRTRKVIEVLRALEARINAMIDIWGFSAVPEEPSAATPAPAQEIVPDEALPQSDIDFVLVEMPRPGNASPTTSGMVEENFGFTDLPEPAPAANPNARTAPLSVVGGRGETSLADIDRMTAADKSRLFT